MKQISFGFLGAGQLAYMSLPYFSKYQLKSHILGPKDSPALAKADNAYVANLDSYQDILRFAQDLEYLSYEIESINIEALYELEKQGKKVLPSTKTLQIAKNKFKQKELFQNLGIPSSAFEYFESMCSVYDSRWDQGFLKLPEGGYDGRGVLSWSKDISYNSYAWDFTSSGYIEEKLDIKKELAIQVARNTKGQVVCFPIVEMVFDPNTNQLDYLKCEFNTASNYKEQIQKISMQLAETLELEGLLAIEFFVSKENKLYVNEMAPRTHNSGHHSMESCNVSQFEQQLRAILNLDLELPILKKPACMLNIIGMDLEDCKKAFFNEVEKMEDTFFHFYDKKEAKAHRKMGHINFLADDIEKAEANLRLVRTQIAKYNRLKKHTE